MELSWTTVLFEMVNFGALALLLGRFLFKPVRAILRDRKAELEGIQAEAQRARDESEATKQEFEHKKRTLDDESDNVRKEATIQGEVAARKIVEATREEMRTVRISLDTDLERARADAIARLRPELIALTSRACGHVLQEIAACDLAGAFARKGAEKLRDELAGKPKGWHVVARVSPDADVYAVSLTLKEILGDAEVEIREDSTLVGGVVLASEGLEVEACASASLDRWLHAETVRPQSSEIS